MKNMGVWCVICYARVEPNISWVTSYPPYELNQHPVRNELNQHPVRNELNQHPVRNKLNHHPVRNELDRHPMRKELCTPH